MSLEMHPLIRKSATEIVSLLKAGEITPFDCLDALEQRIAEVNGRVNALPTLCFDRARRHATELMRKPVEERGPLAGLPVVIKDLMDVEGVRCTQGSLLFKDRIATSSDLLVKRLERNGGIVYALSNTPEFGAGANTFNEVFGATLNPWNTERSAAGSSGGSAVALATGMAWLAHGSDLGGSLRNPASFCSVVGLRPSPGRVAETVYSKIDATMPVEGPMARNVEDVALFLDALTGEEPANPISLPSDGTSFFAAADANWLPKKVAVSRDLGITPVDGEVAEIVMKAARRFAELGVEVEEAHPDFSGIHECFGVFRALSYATGYGELLKTGRDKLKPEVIWNTEKGLNLTGGDIARAEILRGELFRRVLRFFETYDLILCPATIVSPYPVGQRYVAEVNGHTFSNYYEWLAIAYAFTTVCCPAISIAAGFTRENLPVGLQIAAAPRGEARLLAGARQLERLLGHANLVPIDPRTP
jgi:amidase